MVQAKEASTHVIKTAFEGIQQGATITKLEPLKRRKERLRTLLTWINSNEVRIQEAIFKDFRKSAGEVDITELYPVLTEIKHTLKKLDDWNRPEKIDAPLSMLGTTSYVQYEPKGACLIIAPWNYPFNLAIGPLVPCIAAGNTAIIKPSEMTPHTSNLIAELVTEVFEPSIVTVLQGGVDESQKLLSLPFDHIFFTGSPQIGKIVMKAAAKNLTSVTLELGGKSPTIIDKKCNLKDAAQKIAWGKYINAGQTCIAPDYLLVHKEVESEFLGVLRGEVIKQFKGNANSFADSESYPRIVNTRHFERLSKLLRDAISRGAELILGDNVDEQVNFIPPIIIKNVASDSVVMEEEIFGPILPVITYYDIQEAIDIINSKPKPLALYYFGNNKANMKKVVGYTSSGNVCINETLIHFGHPSLPFGGVNNSGIGKSHGKYGFLAFSNEKGVLKQRVGITSSKFIYPPYTPFKKQLLKLMKKYL